jgi:hypothetical protein
MLLLVPEAERTTPHPFRQHSTVFYICIPTNWKKKPIPTLLRTAGDSRKRELEDEEDELLSMMNVTVPETLQYSLRPIDACGLGAKG